MIASFANFKNVPWERGSGLFAGAACNAALEGHVGSSAVIETTAELHHEGLLELNTARALGRSSLVLEVSATHGGQRCWGADHCVTQWAAFGKTGEDLVDELATGTRLVS
jgi:hypothetical protein